MAVPQGKVLVQCTVDHRDLNKEQQLHHAVIGDAKLVIRQLIEEVKKQMGKNAVGLIGRAPFARGALFHDKRGLAALSQSVSATPAQAAIRLAMQLNPHGTVLIGMTNRQHLRENLRALELSPISDEKLAMLKSLQRDEKFNV